MLEPMVATEGEEVKALCVFVSDESARHRWIAYNESLQMSRKSRTGLPRSVLSQVPKCEAPGAPSFSGCPHLSGHLRHPPPGFCARSSFCREFPVSNPPETRINRAGGFSSIDKMTYLVESETRRGYSGLSDELFASLALTLVSCQTR